MKKLLLSVILILCSQVFGQEQYYGIKYPESVLHTEAFDPFYGREALDQVRIGELIFSRLWRWNEKLVLEPDLVEAMPEPLQGGLVATLHPDAKWPDGEPITVEDIQFTLEAYRKNGDEGEKYIANMMTCEKLGERRFLLKPKSKLDIPFEYSTRIWMPRIQLLPEHILAGVPEISAQDQYVQKPVGSGPFQIKNSTETGARQEIIFERNSHYTGPPLMIREVRVVTEPSFTQQYNSILTPSANSVGEIDLLIEDLSDAQLIQQLRNARHLQMEPYARNSWIGIALNTRKSILNSVTFRKILDKMINDKQLIIARYGNDANDITGPLLPEFGFYKTGLDDRIADKSQILNELKSAGYIFEDKTLYYQNPSTGERAPVEFKMIYNSIFVTSASREDNVLRDIKKLLEEYGIKLTLVGYHALVFNEKLEDYDNWDMAFVRHTFGWDSDISPIFERGGPFNYTGYSDPRLSNALNGMKSMNAVLRRQAGERVHQHCYDNVPYIFLWHVKPQVVYRNIINNISITPLTYFTTIGEWEIEPRSE